MDKSASLRGAKKLRLLFLTIIIAGSRVSALGQIDPDDTGEGAERGLAQESNSGQVGTVTLFARGARQTLVVLAVASAPADRSEPALLLRGHSCTHRDSHATLAAPLERVTRGISRTIIPWSIAALLSGNYVVEVFARAGSRRVGCAELNR